MVEVFDNSKPMDLEEMTDSQFEHWIRQKQNEIAATSAGGQVSEAAKIMLQIKLNLLLSPLSLWNQLLVVICCC